MLILFGVIGAAMTARKIIFKKAKAEAATPATARSAPMFTTQGVAPTGTGREAVLLTLSGVRGFDLTSFTTAADVPFILAYDKRDLDVTTSLSVIKIGSPYVEIHTITLTATQRSWYGEFKLAAGSYFVGVHNHPEWVCTFTVN